MSQATYFNWKKNPDGLLPTEMKRLEDENDPLRKLVAEMLPRHVSGRDPPKALGLGRKRELVDVRRSDRCMSTRRASLMLEMDSLSYHCRSRRPDQAGLEARIKYICQTSLRYGYRRMHTVLNRERWRISREDLQRLGPAGAKSDAQAPGEGQAEGDLEHFAI